MAMGIWSRRRKNAALLVCGLLFGAAILGGRKSVFQDEKVSSRSTNYVTRPHPDSTGLCRELQPAVVFFMRIPKCASTSFVWLLRQLSSSHTFQLSFQPRGAFNWDEAETRRVADSFISRKNIIHAEHFYHVNFRDYGLPDYSYMSIVREPVSRVVSAYLYYHFSTRRHIKGMLSPAYVNESILECVTRGRGGCEHNLMTKYFCGHDVVCSTDSERSLEIAKVNMKSQFSVVAVLEHMELSLKVMKAVLPTYFEGLKHFNIPMLNRNERTANITDIERDAIFRANVLDNELYRFAYQLLVNKAAECNLV